MLSPQQFMEKYQEGQEQWLKLHTSGWDDVNPEWGPVLPLVRWALAQPLEEVHAYIETHGSAELRQARDRTDAPVDGMGEVLTLKKLILVVIEARIPAIEALDDEEWRAAFNCELLKLVLLVHWAEPSLPAWVVDSTKARSYPRHLPLAQAA